MRSRLLALTLNKHTHIHARVLKDFYKPSKYTPFAKLGARIWKLWMHKCKKTMVLYADTACPELLPIAELRKTGQACKFCL
jgi:hypothetical protein